MNIGTLKLRNTNVCLSRFDIPMQIPVKWRSILLLLFTLKVTSFFAALLSDPKRRFFGIEF